MVKMVEAGRIELPSELLAHSRICTYNHLPVFSFGHPSITAASGNDLYRKLRA